MKTIQELLSSAKDMARIDAEILIAHVIKKSREFVVAHSETNIEHDDVEKIQELFKRRAAGEPLAYLTGHKEFYGLDFEVNKHTLIPRPETEQMVKLALDKIRDGKTFVIDVGTGSGCIPISIGKEMRNKKSARNATHSVAGGLEIVASDVSRGALEVAQRNAQKYNVNITFLHGNLLDPIPFEDLNVENVIVTANLPYLTEDQFKDEPTIQHEPKSALVAEDNGLALYKELLEQIKTLISPRPELRTKADFQFPISLFMEIDPTQSQPLSTYIKTLFPNPIINIHKDFAGHDRIVELSLTEPAKRD